MYLRLIKDRGVQELDIFTYLKQILAYDLAYDLDSCSCVQTC